MELTQAVQNRIAEEKANNVETDPEIAAMKEQGSIEQNFLINCLKRGDKEKIFNAISALTDIPKSIVISTLTNPRPKRICALCYKAGISAKASVTIQSKIAQLPKSLIIHPTQDGQYPLSLIEMAEILEELD